jgi:hypothetical protein
MNRRAFLATTAAAAATATLRYLGRHGAAMGLMVQVIIVTQAQD